jgi:ribosomal protein S18 acetylase RimI-like enzyme
MRIRRFDRARDEGFLRSCVMELQEIERVFDARLPPAPDMVDAYCDTLLARCIDWRGTIFIAEADDRPLGLLVIFLQVPEQEADEPPGTYASISDLVIVREARGHGVGAVLLRHAEDIATRAGADVLRLEVMAGNEPALAFYARLGWRARLVQMEKRL